MRVKRSAVGPTA